jgi:hypothetical protein
MVECILDNAEDCSPEQIAQDLYDLDLDAVRRILAFAATAALANPETLYMNPICDRCKRLAADRLWWDNEKDAACPFDACCTKQPVAYTRADILDRQMDEIGQRAAEDGEELYSRILMLQSEIDRLKAEIDTPRERRGFS